MEIYFLRNSFGKNVKKDGAVSISEYYYDAVRLVR